MWYKTSVSEMVMLVVCSALAAAAPGTALYGASLAPLLLNGDFEANFYPYGAGYVAENWIPYVRKLADSPPQFLRSTRHKHDRQASQQIWADWMPWYAGIMQTTLLTKEGGVGIQAGKRFTVHLWTYSAYGGTDSSTRNDKINKRVGIHPRGAVDPDSEEIIWTPWHGQDKTWVQINAAAEALGDRLTIFVEAQDEDSGGQDQFYVDGVWLEEEGASTPTRTEPPTPTATSTPDLTVTPTPTATPAIAVLRTIAVGLRPQEVAVLPSSDRFFVANTGDDTVSSLEGFFNWRHTRLQTGGHRPSNVAVDPGRCRMYVTHTTSDEVTVYGTCGNALVGSINLGNGYVPDGIAVLTSTNTIFVSNSAADSVSVASGATLDVIKRIPTGPRPGAIAVNPTTANVYVCIRGNVPARTGELLVLDGIRQTIVKTVNFSATDPSAEPRGVAVNPVTGHVYVTLAGGHLVIIDDLRGQVIGSVPAPEPAGLDAVAVNPATNNVFVSSTAGERVFVYDADRARWVQTLSVGAGWPRGISANPLTHHVVVSNPSANTVSLIRDYGWYQPFQQFLPLIAVQ